MQVVSYGDVREPSLRREKLDVEGGIVSAEEIRGSDSHVTNVESDEQPIALQDTPFFHFDVVSAVRAAESGLGEINSTPSVGSVGMDKR